MFSLMIDKTGEKLLQYLLEDLKGKVLRYKKVPVSFHQGWSLKGFYCFVGLQSLPVVQNTIFPPVHVYF